MKLKKIINIYGGPGVGKSTIAAGLFCEMKKNGLNVELVTEYAKDLVYEERFDLLKNDQLYVFAKQHRKILRLKDTVEFIVTDSPLLFSIIYNRLNPTSIYDSESFENLVFQTYKQYPNMDVQLLRNDIYNYQTSGRTQTTQRAREIDLKMAETLNSLEMKWEVLLSDPHTVFTLLGKILGWDKK